MREILAQWIVDPDAATAQPMDEAGSFSGARLWRVEFRGRPFVLRLWPREIPAGRIASIHAFQHCLAKCGMPVPAPIGALAAGQTVVHADGGLWELAPWMPGVADYWHDPRPTKLAAALRTLAQVHLAVAGVPVPDVRLMPPVGVAPGLSRREDRLHSLLLVEFKELTHAVGRAPLPVERQLIDESLRLIERALPAEIKKSLGWRDRQLPLQWCLRDVWHDHVLFTGERVTGLIDFGAVAFDSPAGDVARLLGSLVGDDRDGWRIGLDAYEAVRPMSDAERAAVDFFDTSGTVLSAGHWIVWLWPKPGVKSPAVKNRAAALARLQRLVLRLRALVERQG